eukprot:3935051-Rhodomonas_salina.5
MACPVLAQRMVLWLVRYWLSVWCYGVSGTDFAYGATRLPYNSCTGTAPLGHVRYSTTPLRYAVLTSDILLLGRFTQCVVLD